MTEKFVPVIMLTHLCPMVPFYTPWKHQKTKGFLMFLGWYKIKTLTWNGTQSFTLSFEKLTNWNIFGEKVLVYSWKVFCCYFTLVRIPITYLYVSCCFVRFTFLTHDFTRKIFPLTFLLSNKEYYKVKILIFF